MPKPDDLLLPLPHLAGLDVDAEWNALLTRERVALRHFSTYGADHALDEADEREIERPSWSGVVGVLTSLTIDTTEEAFTVTDAWPYEYPFGRPNYVSSLARSRPSPEVAELRTRMQGVGADVGELRGVVSKLREELGEVRRMLEGAVMVGSGSSAVLQAIAASVSSHVDQAGPEETVTAELAAILYPDEEPPANER